MTDWQKRSLIEVCEELIQYCSNDDIEVNNMDIDITNHETEGPIPEGKWKSYSLTGWREYVIKFSIYDPKRAKRLRKTKEIGEK